jgi:hypothetical protein
MAELKRMNEDYLMKQIHEAQEIAQRILKERVVELVQELRQAVRATPMQLDPSIDAAAVYVNDFEIDKIDERVDLYQVELRFSGQVRDERGMNQYVTLIRHDPTRLPAGSYRATLIISKLEE